MPWTPDSAPSHTRKASTPTAKRQWSAVANSVLSKGGSEGSAIRQANSVVKNRSAKRAAKRTSSRSPRRR